MTTEAQATNWLAATRELILRMEASGISPQGQSLARRIDAEMLVSQTALDLWQARQQTAALDAIEPLPRKFSML